MDAFAQTLEGWHDFYMFMGTAAATLIGLLFVGLTLNVEMLQRDEYGDIRDLAGGTVANLIYVVLFAAVFLIPGQSPTGVGLPLLCMGTAGLLNASWHLVEALRHEHHAWGSPAVVRRLTLPIIAFVALLIIAIGLFSGKTDGLYWLVGVILYLVGSAGVNAWDILMRMRRTD